MTQILLRTPVSGGLNDLFDHFDKYNKGCAFFILKIPQDHAHQDFPTPALLGDFDGFLDFSDDLISTVDPKTFNQHHHAFQFTEDRTLMFGVVGPKPLIYEWAQEWLNHTSTIGSFRKWMKDAVWLPHDEIRRLDAIPDLPSIEQDEDFVAIEPEGPSAAHLDPEHPEYLPENIRNPDKTDDLLAAFNPTGRKPS